MRWRAPGVTNGRSRPSRPRFFVAICDPLRSNKSMENYAESRRSRLTSAAACICSFTAIVRANCCGEKWDLVHCWEEPYIVAGGQVAWWTPRATPLVFWTAQNISKRYPPPFSAIEKYCVDRCTGWMGSGRLVIDTMLARGYGRKPHRVTPLGVDIEQFRPDSAARETVRLRLGWSRPGPPVVGYMGRFVEEKGVGLLMRVLDRVTEPWRALFVGGGVLEESLRQWAARYGDRVRIVKDVAHDQVPASSQCDGLALRAEPGDPALARTVRADGGRSLCVRHAGDFER